jgi:hypothetical protein
VIPPPTAATPWPVWQPHDTRTGREWVLTTGVDKPATAWTFLDDAIAGVELVAVAVARWLVRRIGAKR